MNIIQMLKTSCGLMKRTALMLAVLMLIPYAVQATTVTKAATGTDLTDGASWGGTAPTSGDVASWVSTSLGASLTLGSPASWGSIGIASALSAVGITGAGTLTLGAGGINMSVSTVDLTLGTPIVLGASQTWDVNSGRTLTSSGIISGSTMGLTKAGLGTLTLKGANTYDGTTAIRGGTLVADTASTATILNSASPLEFASSGTFQLKGLSSQNRSQILNGLTLTGGAATVDANNTGTSTTIDLRGTGGAQAISRSAGTTVDFKATTGSLGNSAVIKTAQANDGTGILGAWATVATGNDWAINNGAGVVTNYTGYNTLSGTTLASAGTVNYRVASNPTTPSGNITMATTGTIGVNTLRINDTAARTIDIRNNATQGILRFGVIGGLLTSGGAHIIGVSGAGNFGTITAGGSTADNPGELVVNNAPGLTINSVIANNGAGAVTLTKSGAGTLTLNNLASTYSGGTVINAGSVTTAATGNTTDLYFGTGSVTVNSGATLALNRTYVLNNLALNNATVSAGNSFGSTLASGSTITLSGLSTVYVTGNLTISGNISGTGGLIKTGGSVVPVTGANNYTGPTIVTGGTLKFKTSIYGNDTAKWIPANITVGNGASLALNVGGAGEFTIAQAGILFSNLATGVSNNGLQSGALIGIDTSGAGGAIQIYSSTISDATGAGAGAVGIKHLGAGTLELTGPNTYSGSSITDNNGTLKISSINSVSNNVGLGTVHAASSSLGAPTTIANGTIGLGTSSTFQGGNLTYTGTGETTDRVINFGGANGTSYTFDQSGSGVLKFTSAFTISDNRGPKTITLQGSTNGKGEIAGVIPLGESTAKPNHLTKSGTGTWTLTAANANAGGLFTVNGGALVLNNATAIPGGIGVSGGLSALTFNGGVLGLGAGDFFRTNGAAGAVTAVNFTGNGGWAAYGADRAVNLGGASATITWATANTGFNGKTLILGANTATHTVDFQNPIDMGNAARTIQTDDGSAVVDGKISGPITGIAGGNLTKTGAGTLLLTAMNTYTGTTTVSAGTLLVNGSLGTNTVTVNSGATLGGTGTINGKATFSTGAKALFTVTRDPASETNVTPLTVAGVMTYNTTEVHLNLPANLPSGVYTLATSAATPSGSVNSTPVVDSGSFAAGFTSAVISLDTVNKLLLLTVNGLPTNPTVLAISSINGGMSPTANLGFSVVVQSQDANGAARRVLADTGVTLSLNTGSGALSGTLTGTITAGSSSVTISGVLYDTAESGVVLTVTRDSGDTLTAADSTPFTVLPDTTPTYLTVTSFPTPQTAGMAGSVTVTAKTVSGTTATTYTGTIHFTSTSVAAGLPADYTFVGGDNGVHTFNGVTLNTVGTQSLTATDTVTASITGTQSGIVVTPANAAVLTVAGFPTPQGTGVAGSLTVTAKDAYGNIATNYSGTIHFTSSDGAAAFPADYTFVAGDLGVHVFSSSVTLNTLGTQSITATDTVTGSITGTQPNIIVWIPATVFSWNSTASGSWSVPGNWTNDTGVVVAPVTTGQPDYTLNFNKAGTYTATHNLSNGLLLNRLNFGGATVTLDGNSLAFTNNGAVLPQLNQNSALSVNVNNALILGDNTTFGGTGNGQVSLTGSISGPGSLTKSSSGTLSLAGISSYTGGTIVSAGTLSVQNASAVGSAGNVNVTVQSGATLNIGSGVVVIGNLTMNGGTLNISVNGPTPTWAGPVTLTADSIINNQSSGGGGLISGNIGGASGFTKTGSDILTLSGTNTYSGATTINVGTLVLSSSGSINGCTNIVLAAGATFDVSARPAYVLSTTNMLSAKGTGTTAGISAARIVGASAGTVNLGAQPIVLTWGGALADVDTIHPALHVSQGALTLNSNPIQVINNSTVLGEGEYRLIQVGNGTTGVINGTPATTVSVTGTGGVVGNTRITAFVNNGNVVMKVAKIKGMVITLH